jgi:hypothetical protein
MLVQSWQQAYYLAKILYLTKIQLVTSATVKLLVDFLRLTRLNFVQKLWFLNHYF